MSEQILRMYFKGQVVGLFKWSTQTEHELNAAIDQIYENGNAPACLVASASRVTYLRCQLEQLLNRLNQENA